MPRLALLALALTLSGCMNVWRALNGAPNPDVAWVAKTAAPVLGCPEKDLKIVNDSNVRGYEWTVDGCDQAAACKGRWETWECVKLPMPWWFDTDAEQPVRIAMRRLALETDCPEHTIETSARADTAWRNGADDIALRMRACGKSYICSFASGRTDCKHALDEAPAARGDGESDVRDGGQ
jgi:hypothetical protein